jgi:hypothetical protein
MHLRGFFAALPASGAPDVNACGPPPAVVSAIREQRGMARTWRLARGNARSPRDAHADIRYSCIQVLRSG